MFSDRHPYLWLLGAPPSNPLNNQALRISDYEPDPNLKEIVLEIGFIEEMRITWGNTKVPKTLFHYSSYSLKSDLIRLTP